MKNNKWLQVFLEPDDGSQTVGGASAGASRFPAVGGDESASSEAANSEIVEEVKETPTPPPAIDYEKLAQTFGGEIAKVMPKPQVMAQPELSQEEMEKALNKWKPTKEWTAKYGNIETQAEAIQEMVDGVTKHADTIAQARLMQQQKQWEERMTPLIEQQKIAEAEKTQQAFESAYPDLAKPELAPIVGSVVQSFQASGHKFKSRKEFIDAVANGVDGVFKAHNPDYKPTRTKVPVANNSLPVTSPGAGGGGGGGKDTAPTGLPRAVKFFPKIRS